MSRETTRRKLERLVTRGFLSRINGGYVFPMPHERVDLANGFRETLLKTLETIAALGQRPRVAD